MSDIPDPTPGQYKFLRELLRLVPDAMWLTAFNSKMRVGAVVHEAGKRGWIRALFYDTTLSPPLVGPLVGWEDGSMTVPAALLDYLDRMNL